VCSCRCPVTRPYTEETLEELGASGVKNLIVVPISFVSEHIETLEEIDMEYRELAEKAGVTHWRRVPALNTDELFMNDMASMVEDALKAPSVSLLEATSSQHYDIQTTELGSLGSDSGPGIGGDFGYEGSGGKGGAVESVGEIAKRRLDNVEQTFGATNSGTGSALS
jgi:protoporphyrin/coproporphyrin ferrochelatase